MSEEKTPEGTRRHQGRAVRKEIRIDASPEAVWDAWAKPEEIARWFVDAAEGEMAAGATVTWIFESFGYRLPIEVYEAERAKYLAFGGQSPGRPPALQQVVLARDGGATVLRLVNSGFLDGADWDDEFDGVDSGWELALATLRRYLERYPARDRTHRLEMRPVGPASYEAIASLYTTRQGLESWIGGSALPAEEPLGPGSRVKLEPEDGPPLDGEVLAASPRELLLSWPEVEGVLGLKAFRAGPPRIDPGSPAERVVALDWSSWGADDRTTEVERWLTSAVDRLAARARPASG